MSFEKQTKAALTELAEQIQLQLAAKNLDHTGEAARSLEIHGTQLWGIDYLYYLDKGRKAGKFPPSLIVSLHCLQVLAYPVPSQVDFPALGLELDKLVNEMLDRLKEEVAEQAKTEVLTWL
jgi:hypothetical protein